ncbi:SkfA peptide export ATP-binding protein SkfE [Bienertia sinuspersici]
MLVLDAIPDEDMAPQVGLALVGKLFTNISFNIEAMKSILRASWKPIKGMAVREIDKNLVRMKVDKPLPRGSMMKLGGERIWVDIRIERLPGFCYSYGCLGHVLRECSDFDEEVPESEFPYVQWLRASHVKLRGRGNNPEKEVKNKLFQELRECKKETEVQCGQ